ncbi:unnamed protein product, partial [Allacma fusca]
CICIDFKIHTLYLNSNCSTESKDRGTCWQRSDICKTPSKIIHFWIKILR